MRYILGVMFTDFDCSVLTSAAVAFYGNGASLHSVQSLSRVQLFVTPWIAAHQACLSITNSRSSLKLTFIESVMPSSHLILCHPLFLLPPIPPSIRVFSNESTLHMRWPKYWSFSFSIIPSKVHPQLISFRMDWLDLLAVQGILKSLLQHHSSKASILQCSAFFTVQLSHPYMTTGKTIALTRWTFVGKVISLLLNMLSKVMLKILEPRLQQYMNHELPDVQVGLEKAEEPEIKLPTFIGSLKNQESSRKASTSASLTTPKPLTVWITTNCGKFWKRWEYQTTWSASWEICMQVRKQQLELDMEQQTGSK